MHKVAVESAAPEFARLQPAKKEISPLGFLKRYNMYSILNELRWALDPRAEFPRESIVQLTKTTWDDPHTTPILEFADLEETLERRALIQTVTKRIKDCRAVIITLGLAEVWRDVKADVFLNRSLDSIFVKDGTRPIRISSYWFRSKLGQSGGHTRVANPIRTSRRSYRRHSLAKKKTRL